jgi:hypothetical protein
MVRLLFLLASIALLAGCSARERAPGPSLAATGDAAVDCIATTQIRDTRVIDERTIDFHMVGGRVLRNSLPDSCPGLTEDRAFSYRLSIPQLCSVDVITVLHPGTPIPGASCGLGRFQPIAQPHAAH